MNSLRSPLIPAPCLPRIRGGSNLRKGGSFLPEDWLTYHRNDGSIAPKYSLACCGHVVLLIQQLANKELLKHLQQLGGSRGRYGHPTARWRSLILCRKIQERTKTHSKQLRICKIELK
jgi:hypothetical protein